jgi:hypothetical protein
LSLEIRDLIATRNRPMLTALELCIEQLAAIEENNPGVEYAMDCARKALALERGFQET